MAVCKRLSKRTIKFLLLLGALSERLLHHSPHNIFLDSCFFVPTHAHVRLPGLPALVCWPFLCLQFRASLQFQLL